MLSMKQCFPKEQWSHEATQLKAKAKCNEAKAVIFVIEAEAISST